MDRAIQTVKDMIFQRGYKNMEENEDYIIGDNRVDKIVFLPSQYLSLMWSNQRFS